MEDVRINIVANDTALDGTATKLKKLGTITEENDVIFKKSQSDFDDAAKKRHRLLIEEEQDLNELRKRKQAAFDPAEIKGFEKSIKDSTERIRLLSAETSAAAGSMNQVVSRTNEVVSSVKTAYSWIRQAAYILPGIGVSGIILLGYEALVGVISEMVDGFKESAKAVEINNKALDKQIEKQQELQLILEKDITEELLLKGKITEEAKKRFEITETYEKRLSELEDAKLQMAKDLAKEYKMSTADIDKFGKQILKTSTLTSEQLLKVKESAVGGEGMSGHIDEQMRTVAGFNEAIINMDIKQNQSRAIIEQAYQQELDNIHTKTYKDFLDKKKKANDKADNEKEKEDDKAWKLYLKLWESNYHKLLSLYKRDADNFIEQADRKFKGAEKRDEENTKLIIDNLQLEASLTKGKTDDENANFQERINNFKIQYDEKGKITEASQKHLELLEKEHQKNLTDIAKSEADKRKKQIIDELKMATDTIVKSYNDMLQYQIDSIDHQETLQQASITQQQNLAIAGKKNDLAIEQKGLADLEKQRALDVQKQKRAKELEVFLNSVAEYSKTAKNPGEAVAKAIAQVALTRGAEALFMEEGGIIGVNNQKSFGRRHRSGSDIMVQAERGEGMLSVKEMANLGGGDAFMNLKRSLSMPMSERGIPIAAVITQNQYGKEIVYHLKELNDTIKSKPDSRIDFDGLHGFIGSITQNGITEATRYVTPKRGM